MSKGLKRFFIICAITVGLGVILLIAGLVTGGITSMDKMNERYSWFKAGEIDRTYLHLQEGEKFDSIDIKGDLDITICEGNSANTTISFDRDGAAPVLEVDNGVLTVKTVDDDGNVIVNFASGDLTPNLEIYVPKNKK